MKRDQRYCKKGLKKINFPGGDPTYLLFSLNSPILIKPNNSNPYNNNADILNLQMI